MNKFIIAVKRPRMLIFPMVYTMEAFTSDLMTRVLGGRFSQILATIENGVCGYFFYEGEKEKLGKIFLQKLNQANSTKKYIRNLEKNGKKIISFVNKLDLEKDNRTLVSYFKQYESLYKKTCVWGWPLAIVGEFALTKEIKKIITEKVKDDSEAERIFGLLSTPLFFSYINQEEIDLLKVAISGDKEEKIEEHFKRFRWIGFDYAGPDYEKSYFTNRLKIIMEKDKEEIKKELKMLSEKPSLIKKKQEEMFKSLQFDKTFIVKVKALQDLIFIRDRKKEILTEAHFKIEKLLDEVEKRTGVKKELLRLLVSREFASFLTDGKIDKKEIKQRMEFSAVFTRNGKTSIFLGKKAEKFFNLVKEKTENLKEFKGMVGFPGIVSGKVKVLKDASGNLEKGEILVVTMTTVDFSPLMKKASAIITDEGGVTCHAVIISRELKIPCIIGTKIATRVLKTGDLVEVDANKGIIKIIKK